jgi:hypothetical protein
MRFALEGARAIDGVGATAVARVSPTFAGGTGWNCCCPEDETHAERAKDINNTGSRRIGFLRSGD